MLSSLRVPGTDRPSLPAEDASVSSPTKRVQRGHSRLVTFLVLGGCALPVHEEKQRGSQKPPPLEETPESNRGSVPVAEGSPIVGSCHTGLFGISLKKLSSENASTYFWGTECFQAFSWTLKKALRQDSAVVSCQTGGSKCVKPDLCFGPNSIFFEKRNTLEIVTF